MSARVDDDPWNQPDTESNVIPNPLEESNSSVEPITSDRSPNSEHQSQPAQSSSQPTEVEAWSRPDPQTQPEDQDQVLDQPDDEMVENSSTTLSAIEVEQELAALELSEPQRGDRQEEEGDSNLESSSIENQDLNQSGDSVAQQDQGRKGDDRVELKDQDRENQEGDHDDDDDDDDDDDEPFVYKPSRADSKPVHSSNQTETGADSSTSQPQPQPQPPAPAQLSQPKLSSIPIDHSRLATLCSQGPISQLEEFFTQMTSPSQVWTPISTFALANEPNPHSGLGLTPLHYAAKNGKVEICKWLVERGAMVGLEDGEGETALHKAALAGKLPTLTFLLSSGASATSKDSDGWTPLHNACSRGYLDIAKVLIERFGADVSARGGRGGWTPLMNAASNGHLTLVRYLTHKCQVDPFLRNQSGETAYDVAASTFEIFSCQVLEKYENEKWNSLKLNHHSNSASTEEVESDRNSNAIDASKIVPGKGPYNPLALHTTVPILLYENQRLDTRLGTLASHGGKPRWSGTHSARRGKADRRAPSTMPPGPLAQSRSFNTHIDRNDVGLPQRSEPYKLVLPKRGSKARKAKLEAKRKREGRPTNPNSERDGEEESNDQDDLASTPTADSVLRDRASSDAAAGADADADVGGQNFTITNSATGEKSHFWLSDWRIDLTHPLVDPSSGWQYAQTFNAPDEKWVGSIPPPLNRLLEGKGLGASISRAISGGVLPGPGASNGQSLLELASGSNSSGANGNRENEIEKTGWVRRRRWIRVMRRRLDIEFGDDLELAEFSWAENLGKSKDPYEDDSEDDSIIGAASSSSSGGLFSTTRKNNSNLLSKAVNEARSEAKNQVRVLGNSVDYIQKAVTLAGKGSEMGSTPADILTRTGEDAGRGMGTEVAKKMARLDLAVQELRSNAFDDTDADRRSKAEDLLKEYTLQLGQLKQSAGLEEASDEEESDGEDDEDDEFIYPNSFKDDGISVITKVGPSGIGSSLLPSSLRPKLGSRVPSTPSVFGGVAPSEAGTTAGNIRSQDLAGSREFRVPTNEAPNSTFMGGSSRNGSSVYSTADSSTSNVFGTGVGVGAANQGQDSRPILREHNLQAQWERDESVGECRGCSRKFTFFLRKHHCRRCGRIFCDPCSSRRAKLTSAELVIDPALPEMLLTESSGTSRICNSCDAERNLPLNLRVPRGYDALLTHANVNGMHSQGSNPEAQNGTSDVSSRASELNECPVCAKTLVELGGSVDQEEHVRNCLENGGGGSVQGGRYLVYKLPDSSPIVGKECSICMEEFASGSLIARLPCLCYFDRACIDSWLKRGRHCPVHAREW